MKRNTTRGLSRICMLLLLTISLLLCVPAASGFAVHGAEVRGPVTFTNTVDVDDPATIDQVWLATVTAAGADGEQLAFGILWEKDTSGWFHRWRLCLVGSEDTLPPTLASLRGTTRENGDRSFELLNVPPERGHRYETVVSYSPALGALAVRVTDVTDQRLVYTGGFSVPRIDRPLSVAGESVAHVYLPVSLKWDVGAGEPVGTWLPLARFDSRNVAAWIRVHYPGPAADGEFRIRLGEDGLTELARSPLRPGTQWIPLPLDALPFGPSSLLFEYVYEEQVWLRDAIDISLGSMALSLERLDIDREAGTLRSRVRVTSAEPLLEHVELRICAVYEEMVWDETRMPIALWC